MVNSMVTSTHPLIGLLALASTGLAADPPAWNARPGPSQEGRFWRYHWHERGLTNGNPAYETRFRASNWKWPYPDGSAPYRP